jgi:signal transduction histidine kinase/ligand-binding sensor domain-containing protein
MRMMSSVSSRRHRDVMLSAAIGCAVLAWCPPALALNVALDVSQYAHTAWRIRDGFAKSGINSIAQTPDGYLWLGTEAGLLRFDGVRTLPWRPPGGQRLPSDLITSLVAARDGTLWIATDTGLASWKEGQFLRYDALAGSYVGKLYEDREGSIWSTRFTNRWTLCSIQKARVTCFGEDGGPGAGAIGLYEDRTGNLWVGTEQPSGIWRWRPGPPAFHPLPMEVNGIQGLAEDEDGSLLIANAGGLRRLIDGQAVMKYPFPSSTAARILLRDRDGGVWAGTSTRGVVHVHNGINDVFSQADGLSGDDISAIVEDREGTIWVATSGGLDRFRESAVVQYSGNEGLSNDRVTSVLASRDGSVWLGTLGGLNRWTRGEVTVYRERHASVAASRPIARNVREITGAGVTGGIQSLFEDSQGRVWLSTLRTGVGYLENDRLVTVGALPGGVTRAIVEDSRKDLWIAYPTVGLFRLIRGSHDVEQIAWATLKHSDLVNALAADPSGEGLWFGFFQGGVAHFAGGQVRASYAASDGLADGRVSALYADSAGTLWIAANGGLSRLKNGRVETLTSRNGLPCDAVGWVVEDTVHSLWLGMACGLVRVARTAIDAWTAAVDNGHRNAEVAQRLDATVFDQTDGARILIDMNYYGTPVARTPDGKLWFPSQGGVSVVDPAHLPFNRLPPPVQIEQLIADRTTYEPRSAAAADGPLPPLVRDLEIDYAALSLVAPEKNRFKVKLEGWDPDWQDVGNQRQKFYSNLPPRDYRFRVIASNNSGVWNEEGASLDFTILPAYYQTTWFRALVVASALTLLWAAYQLRVRQVAHAFDARLQERVNERTRVARELHDTLLQSFHGLLFRFQAATNMLPERPAEAKQKFESAIDQAAQAITEGRDAVQNLRASTAVTNDLAVAISTLGEELKAAATPAGNHGDSVPAAVHVVVEGTLRDLHPILRDDIYRIAGEALRNSFRHAHARRIEVEITYDDRQFRLQVRDDGKGIDRAVLADERRGHFGLPGMRERAELVGGRLDVWSEVGAGTEVDLTIPAAKAYAAARARRRAWGFGKKTGRDA